MWNVRLHLLLYRPAAAVDTIRAFAMLVVDFECLHLDFLWWRNKNMQSCFRALSSTVERLVWPYPPMAFSPGHPCGTQLMNKCITSDNTACMMVSHFQQQTNRNHDDWGTVNKRRLSAFKNWSGHLQAYIFEICSQQWRHARVHRTWTSFVKSR